MAVGKKTNKSCLFNFGVSFVDNDAHILQKIQKGKVVHLFVTIYGDPSTQANKQIIEAAETLKRQRRYDNLEISYYNAQSASVWG